MTDEQTAVLTNAASFITALLSADAGGHDHFHAFRVEKTAAMLAKETGADEFTVRLAAVLHDADDRKLFPETAGNQTHARYFLAENGVSPEKTEEILAVIREVSFRGTDSVTPETAEGKCVQDADRLDALGALGIARAFAYGGAHNRPLYDPAVPPVQNMDEKAYRANVSPTVNHFYEKLFLLKDALQTETARRLAEERERFMRAFLEEFYAEWAGER